MLTQPAPSARARAISGESSDKLVAAKDKLDFEDIQINAGRRFPATEINPSRTRSGRRSTSRSRSSRNRKSGTEVIKVIIGGLLAIPIAYMLVIWVFRQDPINIGPKIGNAIPFLVPAEFRPTDNVPNDNPAVNQIRNSDSENSIDGESKDADSLPVPDVDPDRVRKQG